MKLRTSHCRIRSGHTLMELTVAMVASAFLMAGLGGVMLIGREVAYTPTASQQRTKASSLVNQIAEELRYATLVLQQSPQVLEFVVNDRNGDLSAEKIKYEWSGVAGDPLYKTINAATAVPVLDSVNSFNIEATQISSSTQFTATIESSEVLLASNATSPTGPERALNFTRFTSQRIDPTTFGAPSNAISWNATRVQFVANQAGFADSTLLVQIRAAGDPNNTPTGDVLGQRNVAESSLVNGWNSVTFASPIRNLALHRRYAMVLAGLGWSDAAAVRYNDNSSSGVSETSDAGASWTLMPSRQIFYRLYGTYNSAGDTYTVNRTHISHISITLQTATHAHARIDARIPLTNRPELLQAYWRADFDDNPVASNRNGDLVNDWAYSGNGSFNTGTLINGVWHASGAIQTRPLSNFTSNTVVEVGCRNTTTGGNGAVMCINVDRQGNQYAPLLVYVQRQSNGTQTLSLYGKTSNSATKLLCSRSNLSSGFIRYRLTILPQSNAVNLTINEVDQGTFGYPTFTPSASSDAYLTVYADTSLAEFDYVDVRVQ